MDQSASLIRWYSISLSVLLLSKGKSLSAFIFKPKPLGMCTNKFSEFGNKTNKTLTLDNALAYITYKSCCKGQYFIALS